VTIFPKEQDHHQQIWPQQASMKTTLFMSSSSLAFFYHNTCRFSYVSLLLTVK
jgi:uncharacterized UPF0160 family protein